MIPTPHEAAARHVVVFGGWAPSLLRFRRSLLVELVGRGHRVTAMAADGDLETCEELGRIGVAYEEVPLRRAGLDPIADLALLRFLTRRFRVLRPDVFLGYTIKPVIYGNIAARFARVPRRYALITGLGYAFLGQDQFRRRALQRMVAALYRGALSGTHGVFVQNEDDRRDLAAAGALPAGVAVTPVRGSGVDPEEFAPAALPVGDIQFLFLGRLLVEKGILEYVELARRIRSAYPDARFRVAGWIDPNPSSIARPEVDRWCAQGWIEYLGNLSDVRPALAAAHVLVLPSYREGTPRSVLEAMSMGRPVIVTDVPGSRDTIVDGEHGFVVPARDVDALVTAASAFLTDRGRIADMGRHARERVCELYDARRIAEQMVATMLE